MLNLFNWLTKSSIAHSNEADQRRLAPSIESDTLRQSEHGPLLLKCMSEDNLFAAWEKVKANDGGPGADGVTVKHYSNNILGRLQHLRSLVLKKDYRPVALKQLAIDKQGGGQRILSIPAVPDRILQTAVTQILTPIFEKEFENSSYGYRRGRSVAMAINQVCKLRDEGFNWVVDADIEKFFDRINHNRLYEILTKYVSDQSLRNLLSLWISIPVVGKSGSYLLEVGVPQGSPLSPLLANLFLDEFDERIHQAGHQLVRFADDFVVLCQSQEVATTALSDVKRILGDLKLLINTRKTNIVSFSDSFTFLGVRFAGHIVEAIDPEAKPWLLPENRPVKKADTKLSPNQNRKLTKKELTPPTEKPWKGAYLEVDTLSQNSNAEEHTLASQSIHQGPRVAGLYVASHGHVIRNRADRVEVFIDKQRVQSLPIEQIDHVLITGRGLVSTTFLAACQARSIPCIIDQPGATLVGFGALAKGPTKPFLLQLEMANNMRFHLTMAKSFVYAKLNNSKVILRRFARRSNELDLKEQLRVIDDCQFKLSKTNSLDEIRGLEGAAAAAYFKAFKLLLPDEMNFPGRRRRPPKDPVNVLLSFGYTILHSQVNYFVQFARLNAHLGHLHHGDRSAFALCNDIMEEFRALIVDAVILTLCRGGQITNSHFTWQSDADLPCFLSPEGRKIFLTALENKFNTKLIHPREKTVLDLRSAIKRQVEHYLRVLSRDEAIYKGFLAK